MQRLAAVVSKKGLREAIPAGIDVLLCDAAIKYVESLPSRLHC